MKSLWKVKGFEKQTSWKVMRFSRENEQKKVTPTCTLTTWSFQRAAPHTPHSNTAQQHSTIVKLLKQMKNWQSPSRDPWSNCLINSREDDKGQSYYYSGRQKDNSKTICRCAGYN